MNKAALCAIASMSALGACDRGESAAGTDGAPPARAEERAAVPAASATPSLRDERSSAPNSNTQGTAAADASVVRTVLAKLDPRDAEARFVAAPKVKLQGEARLNQRVDGVRVDVVLVEGPPGTHGIHIHQKADCSDIPGKSMGEHLAPEGKPHGLPSSAAHHLGDLGNIEVAPDGTANFEIIVRDANLQKDHDHSFLNRAVVIHEKRDFGTGRSGESGTPIACAAFVGD